MRDRSASVAATTRSRWRVARVARRTSGRTVNRWAMSSVAIHSRTGSADPGMNSRVKTDTSGVAPIAEVLDRLDDAAGDRATAGEATAERRR